MAPPLRGHGRGCFRWLWRRIIYWLLLVSIVICIATKLMIKYPSLTCPNSNCYCDCSYHDFLPISCEFISSNNSTTEIDLEMMEELRKDRSTMIKEEIDLLNIVSDENMQRYKLLTETAMQSASKYKKERYNCNIGVKTCEEARERAEEQLLQESKLTALWRTRAELLLIKP